MRHRGIVAASLCALLCMLAVLLPAGRASFAATSSFCSLKSSFPGHTFVWTGAAPGSAATDFANPANWSTGTVPGAVPLDPSTHQHNGDTVNADYVCIGTNANGTKATAVLAGGDEVGLAALDLGESATLTLQAGSKLYVNGGSGATASYVRTGTILNQLGATLGGHGNVIVGGRLNWTTVPATDVPVAAATQTTRECDSRADCGSRTTTPGRTTIASGGVMAVNGNATLNGQPFGGVNLEDGRVIDNSGTITLSNAGYIAADHGTAITNEKGGVLLIQNNEGIFEGRDIYTTSTFTSPLPVLTNNGTLSKTAGAATGVIGIGFAAGTGSVAVKAGTLSIAGVSAPTASVQYGTTYATAVTCTGATAACQQPTTAQPQLTAVQPAKAFLGAALPTFAVAQQAAAGDPNGKIGQGVTIAQNAQATTANPTILTFTFAARLFGSSTAAQFAAEKALYFEQKPKGGTFTKITKCLASGAPSGSATSCIDGTASTKPSTSGGAVHIVIRTHTAVPSSRWVAI